jgi:hypothetical protein
MALITGNLFEGRSRRRKDQVILFDDQLPNFVLRATRAGAKALSASDGSEPGGKRMVRFTLGQWGYGGLTVVAAGRLALDVAHARARLGTGRYQGVALPAGHSE